VRKTDESRLLVRRAIQHSIKDSRRGYNFWYKTHHRVCSMHIHWTSMSTQLPVVMFSGKFRTPIRVRFVTNTFLTISFWFKVTIRMIRWQIRRDRWKRVIIRISAAKIIMTTALRMMTYITNNCTLNAAHEVYSTDSSTVYREHAVFRWQNWGSLHKHVVCKYWRIYAICH
jgi:hypothetical protein